MVFSKNVRVVVKDTDRYGRTVGKVYVGDTYVNRELVAAGRAWWYRQFAAKDSDLQQAEAAARAERHGLWQGTAPVAPWQWRREKAANSHAAP